MLHHQPAATILPQCSASVKLTVPLPPPQKDQIDLEKVQYWTQNEWLTQRCQERNKDFKKLGFLTDENGEVVVVDDTRLKVFSEFAKQFWNSLHSENQGPDH